MSRFDRCQRPSPQARTQHGLRAYAADVPELRLDVVCLDPELGLPSYARDGDAGLDLRARTDVVVPARGGRRLIPTGIAIALADGHAGLVLPRSGLALNNGVTVLNAPGLIDCGYRDEIKVVLINTDPDHDYAVARGDRVAQLVVQRVERIVWQPVEHLDGQHRGGGFGHTGR
jgi:dUTP pyrophosphatase